MKLTMTKLFAALLFFVFLVGCQFPNDSEETLNKVEDGILKVGATENPPWVVRSQNGAEGVEASMIQVFAETLGADVEWHWGTETELLEALAQHQVHVVIGGLTQQSPAKAGISYTEPYYTSRITVGFPPTHKKTTNLDKVKVALPVVNQYSQALESRGAMPQPMENLSNLNMPVAHTEWWLKAQGYQPGPWDLFTEKHLLAVAEGENAFLMRLQKYIDDYSAIDTQLEAWASQSLQ